MWKNGDPKEEVLGKSEKHQNHSNNDESYRESSSQRRPPRTR
jgi:hypothetical protein